MQTELVRCGCGVLRSLDEDAAIPGGAWRLYEARFWLNYEAPRACRRCGVIYCLPKPQLPSEGNPGDTPPA